jgi:hypothetical protein
MKLRRCAPRGWWPRSFRFEVATKNKFLVGSYRSRLSGQENLRSASAGFGLRQSSGAFSREATITTNFRTRFVGLPALTPALSPKEREKPAPLFSKVQLLDSRESLASNPEVFNRCSLSAGERVRVRASVPPSGLSTSNDFVPKIFFKKRSNDQATPLSKSGRGLPQSKTLSRGFHRRMNSIVT